MSNHHLRLSFLLLSIFLVLVLDVEGKTVGRTGARIRTGTGSRTTRYETTRYDTTRYHCTQKIFEEQILIKGKRTQPTGPTRPTQGNVTRGNVTRGNVTRGKVPHSRWTLVNVTTCEITNLKTYSSTTYGQSCKSHWKCHGSTISTPVAIVLVVLVVLSVIGAVCYRRIKANRRQEAGPSLGDDHLGVKCPRGHELQLETPESEWVCDEADAGGCKSGITEFNPATGGARFHCQECDYDLCNACYLQKKDNCEPQKRFT